MASHAKTDEALWLAFAKKENLSAEQVEKFKTYYNLLIEANESFNLTAITSLRRVMSDHFSDSLELRRHVDLNAINTIADVGPGAGFPSIPLKIIAPHLNVLLIEVTYKKQQFLKTVIEALGLTDVEVCPLDWRTFLRTTSGQIDLFTSRATFDDVELCRLFRQTSDYRSSTLVYWASKQWEINPKCTQYLDRTISYAGDNKERRLAFFKAPLNNAQE